MTPHSLIKNRYLLLLVAGLLGASGVAWYFVRSPRDAGTPESGPQADPTFVGRSTCADCHQKQLDRWKNSHHDLAMQKATPETVKADFDGSTFSNDRRTFTFFRKNKNFHVRVKNDASGETKEYPVPYTFGTEPLQQYLLSFPGGRLQALTIAWDRREKNWFSLYPDRTLENGDWLHWTGRSQNWNSNCASCHSTNYRKNYNRKSDTYDSKWSEIDVSCEACHGPGSRHVKWARNASTDDTNSSHDEDPHDYGLVTRYTSGDVTWRTGPGGTPVRANPGEAVPDTQLTECGRCHGRRARVSETYRHGDLYLDHFMPTLIEEGVYFPDGQIKEEVYVYGSFRQSKMYREGVRCTDCHDPHGGELKLEGNDLCTQCHGKGTYDTSEHHHHSPDSTGAKCVNCHMPSRTFMQIDDRRDHSFRIPRPDLTEELGTPNACQDCHEDRSAGWAAERINDWTSGPLESGRSSASLFESAWNGDETAAEGLRKLMLDPHRTDFVRASAARTLTRYPTRPVLKAARSILDANDPLLRRVAVQLASRDRRNLSPDTLLPLLDDPVRGVRYAAARALSSMDQSGIQEEQQQRIDSLTDQIKRVLLSNSDTRGGQFSLGHYYQQRGETEKAIQAFQKAIEIDTKYVDARTSLARLYAQQGKQQKAAELLKEVTGQKRPPNMSERVWNRALGDVHFQLGLLYAGPLKQKSVARRHLETARRLAPGRARIYYNLGLLYSQLDRLEDAERTLNRARELQPDNPQFLYSLVTIHRDHGKYRKALEYARQLKNEFPNNPRFRRIHRMLKQRTR